MYQVFDTQTNKTVKDGYKFRRTARVARNKLLSEKPDGLKQVRYIIARGKDHPHGPSNGQTERARSRFL